LNINNEQDIYIAKMHFCEKCDNMYYLKIAEEDSNTLIYYCRNCGNEDTTLTKENICVLDTTVRETEKRYTQTINEYTKYDPTLPRITTIRCPNDVCPSNKEVGDGEEPEREVIYIRYDDINMKYIYMCAKCNTIWKTDEQL